MKTFYVSVTHLILRFGIVQKKFQQTNKTKINHINDNQIWFEVSLHVLGIWPTVCHRVIYLPKRRIVEGGDRVIVEHDTAIKNGLSHLTHKTW